MEKEKEKEREKEKNRMTRIEIEEYSGSDSDNIEEIFANYKNNDSSNNNNNDNDKNNNNNNNINLTMNNPSSLISHISKQKQTHSKIKEIKQINKIDNHSKMNQKIEKPLITPISSMTEQINSRSPQSLTFPRICATHRADVTGIDGDAVAAG